MNIMLVGGGSGGPVTPLLAVAEAISEKYHDAVFTLVGTKHGPEAAIAQSAGIGFASIPAGKWRRYMSVWNVFTPFLVVAGFFASLRLLRQNRPQVVFGAGGFVQVPLIWAAWFLGIPSVIHQQDVYPTLANKLCQWSAARITVTFKDSVEDFFQGLGFFYRKHEEKVVWTGNPYRPSVSTGNRQQAIERFGLEQNFPTLYVTGGGTGAQFINDLVLRALPELTKVVQVIHSTGRGKAGGSESARYKPFEFITDVGNAFAAADIVLSRAGLSTITELSALGKVSIIVPMPHSHQEINAALLAHAHAALVATEDILTPDVLVRLVRKLLFDADVQKEIKTSVRHLMPQDAAQKIAAIITSFINPKNHA